jgi:ribosomal protein S16
MRASKRNAKEATPIHNRQRKLAEEQSQIREKMQQLEQFVADAPRLADEQKRREQEQLIQRASQGARPSDTVGALSDKRYAAQTYPQTRRKGLRSHRRAARLQFFALCILLGVLVIVLLRHIPF